MHKDLLTLPEPSSWDHLAFRVQRAPLLGKGEIISLVAHEVREGRHCPPTPHTQVFKRQFVAKLQVHETVLPLSLILSRALAQNHYEGVL